MTTSLRELTERCFAAVEAKDLPATLACFADDAVLIDPHYPSPGMVGKAEIADGLGWGFGGMKTFGFKIVHYFEAPNGQGAAVEVATHHEPYGPPGVVGIFLGVTRLQRGLSGHRSKKIGRVPGAVLG
jgi:ketosteroid isomerase-like protein